MGLFFRSSPRITHFVIQKAATPKTGVEFDQKCMGWYHISCMTTGNTHSHINGNVDLILEAAP